MTPNGLLFGFNRIGEYIITTKEGWPSAVVFTGSWEECADWINAAQILSPADLDTLVMESLL